MAIQLVFCIETNRRAATDEIYIRESIRRWYHLGNDVKITMVYMESKTNFNSKAVISRIREACRDFSHGSSHIIYCVDTDNYESNQEQSLLNNEIKTFCQNNHFELVWFCHNIEEVFLNKSILRTNKVMEAKSFRRKMQINNIDDKVLMSCNQKKNTSNLLLVLDKYLNRKIQD